MLMHVTFLGRYARWLQDMRRWPPQSRRQPIAHHVAIFLIAIGAATLPAAPSRLIFISFRHSIYYFMHRHEMAAYIGQMALPEETSIKLRRRSCTF